MPDEKESFELVKSYVTDLGLAIIAEDPAEELVVVEDEENGVKNLVIDCEWPILVMEQPIMEVPAAPGTSAGGGQTEHFYRRLLQMNRTLVHGAFVLDEEGKQVIFRDTLQLANLDANELEGSVSALMLALAEHASELLDFAHA